MDYNGHRTVEVVPNKICLLFCFREKEALMGYLKSVERVLGQSKDQVRVANGALGPYEHSLPQLILPTERLAMDGLSLGPSYCPAMYLRLSVEMLFENRTVKPQTFFIC